MFEKFMKKRKEQKYIKEYKAIANEPFCFQYEVFKRLKQRVYDDMLKNNISVDFYYTNFVVKDFREHLAKLLTN